jgi:hypothetical protein
MGVWAAVGILVIGTVVVYACVMCLVPRDAEPGDAHQGHGHH